MNLDALPPRFWSKVTKTETCWLWTGAVANKRGYGRFGWDGKPRPTHRLVAAHLQVVSKGQNCEKAEAAAIALRNRIMTNNLADRAAWLGFTHRGLW